MPCWQNLITLHHLWSSCITQSHWGNHPVSLVSWERHPASLTGKERLSASLHGRQCDSDSLPSGEHQSTSLLSWERHSASPFGWEHHSASPPHQGCRFPHTLLCMLLPPCSTEHFTFVSSLTVSHVVPHSGFVKVGALLSNDWPELPPYYSLHFGSKWENNSK